MLEKIAHDDIERFYQISPTAEEDGFGLRRIADLANSDCVEAFAEIAIATEVYCGVTDIAWIRDKSYRCLPIQAPREPFERRDRLAVD